MTKKGVLISAPFRVSLFGFNSAFESEWSFEGLNRNLFHADFWASSQIAHANLRVFLPEVWPDVRSIPVNARRAVQGVPEGALPVAEVGPRQGEAPGGHRRGSDFQGIRVLHHRLPKRLVQGSGQKGVAIENCRSWRKILRHKGVGETSFACTEQACREKISERTRRVTL